MAVETHTGTLWSAADPPIVADADPVELGAVIQALRPVTLTGIRILGYPNGPGRSGRRARLWSPLSSDLITSVALPDVMPDGWYTVPISYAMADGDTVLVSYDTAGGYAFLSDAFVSDRIAADGAMRYPKGPGNGRFGAAGAYPGQFNTARGFYGMDAVYTWDGELPPPPPPTPGTTPANSAQVAAAWLNAIPGLDAPVATTRPADPSSWANTGFVVVSVIGSAGDRDLSASRRPILQVDAWAVSPGSSKPPRGMAGAIAERVRQATEDPAMVGITVVPRSGSVGYAPAVVADVWLESGEPREIPDPDSSYAHFSMDIGLTWVRA